MRYEQVKLVRLKLFAQILQPEEMDDDISQLSVAHKRQKGSSQLFHIRLLSLNILMMVDHTSNSVAFSMNPLLKARTLAVLDIRRMKLSQIVLI